MDLSNLFVSVYDSESTLSSNKSKQSTGSDTPIEVKAAGTEGGNGTISQKEYDAVVTERDQLKINLYLLGNNLKDMGFNIADSANAIQRIGNDIVQRIKLTPEQVRMMQETIKQQQQQ